MNKREYIFNYIVREWWKIKEGELLPRKARILKWLLFPVKTFNFYCATKDVYDPITGLWTINGIKFTDEFFYYISKPGTRLQVMDVGDGAITLHELILCARCIEGNPLAPEDQGEFDDEVEGD